MGAGRSADNPVTPPRSSPDWSRPAGPSAALPAVADASPTSPAASPASPTDGPRLPTTLPTAPTGGHQLPTTLPTAPTGGQQLPAASPASPTGGLQVPTAPPASPTGGPRLPSAPTEPAAERWIADRLAADRSAADRSAADRSAAGAGADDDFAGYWATDRPAKRRARPAPQDGSVTDESPDDRPGTGERFAGYWVMDGAEERGDEHPAGPRGREDAGKRLAGPGGTAGGEAPGEERFAGYWARDPGERQGAVRDEPTEVMGPFDVGAWSRDAATSPARPRGRQRQPEGTGPVTEQRDDPARKGGGGGEQPPSRGGGGSGGPRRPRRTFGDRIRTFLRGIGQTFITLGLVLLLLAVYEVWFTDLVNHRTQKDLTTSLQTQWDNGDDPTVGTVPTRPGEKVRSIPLGDGFALIYIPDFGTDYVFTVVEGTDLDELNKGPGHYVDTPLPGAVGNVAIAGHRVGKGSPFLNLDKLKAGSAIVIRTRSYWYTYRVVGDRGNADAVSALGFPGREIVDPSDVAVIAPVPDKPAATPTRRLLTLTTCHPKFTARQRMVIHAELDGSPFPVGKGTPPSMTSG